MKTGLDPNHLLIGERIRKRRKLLGLSSQALASILGISHQQLQKYETGVNRVSAGMLANISKALNIDVAYFYALDNILPFSAKADSFKTAQILNEPETTTLVKHYASINDVRTRMAFVELVTSITKLISKKADSRGK